MNRCVLALVSLALSGVLCTAALGVQDEKPGAGASRPEIITNSLGMKLALIPAGDFLMGSPETDKAAQADEKPRHKVRLSRPFYLGSHTVTIGEYRRFVKASSYKTEGEKGGGVYASISPTGERGSGEGHSWQKTGLPLTDNFPVMNVTWADAQAFCTWLSGVEGKSYRLPTEAEWEYACRAGTTTLWWCGDDPEGLRDVANIQYADSFAEHARTVLPQRRHYLMAPVGQYRANPWGLHDMHGNVWQWCADAYSDTYYKGSPGTDPAGPAATDELRVIRGGTWARGPSDCRSANRFGMDRGSLSLWIGFRVVCEKPDR